MGQSHYFRHTRWTRNKFGNLEQSWNNLDHVLTNRGPRHVPSAQIPLSGANRALTGVARVEIASKRSLHSSLLISKAIHAKEGDS